MMRDLIRVLRQPHHWMPREKWDALIRGENCFLCGEVEKEENDFSFLVAHLETSNLRLVKNQFADGFGCALDYRARK